MIGAKNQTAGLLNARFRPKIDEKLVRVMQMGIVFGRNIVVTRPKSSGYKPFIHTRSKKARNQAFLRVHLIVPTCFC